MSFPHNKPRSPLFSQDVLQELHSVLTRFLWRLCFALGLGARESLCAPFKSGVSFSPSPVESLHTCPTGLQCQMLWGSFSQCQIPACEDLMWGSELSLLQVSVNQLVSSLGGFPPGRYGVVCITKSSLLPLDVASSFSAGVGCLFEGFWSTWLKISQPLFVNFVVFMREVELQFFYSTILILSPISGIQVIKNIPYILGEREKRNKIPGKKKQKKASHRS